MAYVKTVWADGATALSSENMNHIEEGIEAIDIGKVDKIEGKGLSTNDFTSPEKLKLSGIQAGAERNRTYNVVNGKPTASLSPAFGAAVTVSQVSQNANGQVSVTDRNIILPGNEATPTVKGLMSAADKSKLDSLLSPGIYYYDIELETPQSRVVQAKSKRTFIFSNSFPSTSRYKAAGIVSTNFILDGTAQLIGDFAITSFEITSTSVHVSVYNLSDTDITIDSNSHIRVSFEAIA